MILFCVIFMIIFGIIALKLFNNSRFTKRWSWMGIFVTITAFIIYGLCSRIEYMKTIELKCHGGEDVNNCGGDRALFLRYLEISFYILTLGYIIYIFFIIRKDI